MTDLLPLLIGVWGDNWIAPLCMIVAWFVQMGLHEGGHAYAANNLGDSTPRMFGRLTFNPIRHIEWRDMSYVFGAVILPIVTAFYFFVPMGMAYVIVARGSTLHDAKVAIAGPIGSFAAALIGVVLYVLSFPVIEGDLLGEMGSAFLGALSKGLIFTSLVYGIFNLFPLPPLDGGTIAYHFLNMDGRRIFDAIRPYGFYILIGIFWILPMISNGEFSFAWHVILPCINFVNDLTESIATMVWGSVVH